MEHNYSKYSEKFKKTENDINNEIETNEIESNDINDEIETNEIESNDISNETTNEDFKTGIVTGCRKLYVRKKADKESEPLCIINENEEVTVIFTETMLEDFYNVCTSTGIEGYCMKKYISVK